MKTILKTSSNRQFKCLFFDLDDTLFDTNGLLIPLALKKSYTAMKKLGLTLNWLNFNQQQKKFSKNNSSADFFSFITPSEEIADKGRNEFYSYQIDIEINPFDGVIGLLSNLQKNYSLHLITSGEKDNQIRKITLLKIEKYFEKLWFSPPFHQSTKEHLLSKKSIFSEIIKNKSIRPDQALSIGNRIDHELKDAKELGCFTCLLKHGEHINLKPKSSLEIPDFTINNIGDLISICDL